GGVAVRIAAQKEDNERLQLKMSVHDTGIGIPAERMDRLFHSFSQADASTSRKYGGTGLGLAICRRLSELMDGEVGVTSEQGKGSTFWCTVSIQKASKETFISTQEKTGCHNFLPAASDLLLVEDNKVNQYVALSILKKIDLDADVAENGVQALEMLRKKKYDLVLMDIQMPEMDGFEATRYIRNPNSGVLRPDVPIIAMTADATKEDRDKCFAAGMNDYVPKPVNREQLFAVLQQQLSQEQTKIPRKTKKCPAEEDREQKSSPDISLDPLPIFDLAALVERMGGYDEGIDEFMHQLPVFLSQDIKELQSVLDEKDLKGILSSAHKIKGMCANASAERVREAAYRMESAARKGDLDAVRSLFSLLEQEEKRLREYLAPQSDPSSEQ
ncbi:MAG: response regulator, partial [Candidatus Electrothrix sp. AX5]|nr:response regulator [Candidatus Electrothrix sp. AX5]